jgi:hypothetical protein
MRTQRDPYDKKANAWNMRYDTTPQQSAWGWVSLRKYRVPRRKSWRKLDIDDPFAGRNFQGRLDDFSNPVKDVLKPIAEYCKQMRDGKRYDLRRYFTPSNARGLYQNNPGDGDSWTGAPGNWLDLEG